MSASYMVGSTIRKNHPTFVSDPMCNVSSTSYIEDIKANNSAQVLKQIGFVLKRIVPQGEQGVPETNI